MQFFENAIFALIVFLSLFFLIFFCLCYAWSAMYKRKERLKIGIIVTTLTSFKILAIGLVILFLASLILPVLVNYIPALRIFLPI